MGYDKQRMSQTGDPSVHTAEFVESYFDAWNHRDPIGVADHLSTDGFYRDVPENRERTHDELVSSLNEFFAQYRHSYELIGEILKSGDTIAYQYRMCPSRSRKNSGASMSYRGAEFITFCGDEAVTIIDYYDIPVGTQTCKYAKSGLTREQSLEYRHRLNRIMDLERAFLAPDLTLPKLATSVGCSVNHLSQVINSGYGMSFFEFLNRHRIDYAKELLARTDYQRSAILNIGFVAGFNSNSAFYSAFRKFVGQTPAQYRRARLDKVG